MELCYEGALVMPSNYVILSDDEMTYVEGGATYSGATGWAVASILAATGLAIAKFADKTIRACIPYVTAMLATGPTGWMCALIVSSIGIIGLGSLVYFGGQIGSAGNQALYYMLTKGRFTITANNNIFSIFTVGY